MNEKKKRRGGETEEGDRRERRGSPGVRMLHGRGHATGKAGRTPGDTNHSVSAPATGILAFPRPTLPGASDRSPCMLLSTAWEASFRSSKVGPADSRQILARNISCGLQETTVHNANPCQVLLGKTDLSQLLWDFPGGRGAGADADSLSSPPWTSSSAPFPPQEGWLLSTLQPHQQMDGLKHLAKKFSRAWSAGSGCKARLQLSC